MTNLQSAIVPPTNRDAAIARIAAFLASAFPGKTVRVKWEIAKRQRSDQQNAYLFGVCYPLLAQAKGYDVADIHAWMCGQHFGWVDRKVPKTPNNPHGLESVPRRTTTRDENGKRNVLKVGEFMDFVAMVQRIGAQAGVFIPDPDPDYWRAAA